MLRLGAIEVRGYRAFAGWARLELRPLTLVYGRNNAGKSSLLRLLAILADSVEGNGRSADDGARSALKMHGQAGRGSKFKELPWMGDGVPRHAFRLRLCWEVDGVPAMTDEFELAWQDERSRSYVRHLVIRDADDSTVFKARALPHPNTDRYLTTDDDADAPTWIHWTGLRPATRATNAKIDDATLIALDDRMQTLRQSVTWLDSNRPRPERIVASEGDTPLRLHHDGRNALKFLASDRELLRSVHAWFASPPIERDLRLKPAGEGYLSPILGSTRSSAEFHLLDAGEGMAHVLPVIVGTELVARGSGYRVLAVEEPESHLHGDTQRSLARRLAEIAAEGDPPILIMETHSRALLLGVQLAIAEGLVPPERCQVLWCDQAPTGVSTLSQIEFTPTGGLVGWPRPALADEDQMVRELLDRQEEALEGAGG